MSNVQSAVPLDQPYYGAPIGAAVQRFFKKYATFRGRASRSEFWWWALVNVMVASVLSGLALATSGPTVDELGQPVGPSGLGLVFFVLYGVWGLVTLIPGIALVVRRLHDSNKSGFWVFVVLVPVVGPIVLLVFELLPADPAGARFDA
ncbi:DUF805 domain-containing protein [Microbacterium sp. NPDC090007]|uniref:DUF805 domain-containing protein n=1 Tax=Microbacterium sp. NPDC090007 TaxID=3364204 RepID=UPI00382E1582